MTGVQTLRTKLLLPGFRRYVNLDFKDVVRNVIQSYDIMYQVFEVRIKATYHGRGGAVALGVSAACKAERV